MPTRKLVAGTIVGLVTFALTKLAIPLDPILEQALNVAAVIVAAYIVRNDSTDSGDGVPS